MARHWWMDTNLVELDNVFFESTKKEKIARIAHIGCDYFIDDLPEILLMLKNLSILFDPEGIHNADQLYAKMVSWQEIKTFLRKPDEHTVKFIYIRLA